MSSPYDPTKVPKNPFGDSPNNPYANANSSPSDNPYAVPQAKPKQGMLQSSSGLWREGDLIVAAHGAIFPSRCVKCGAPVAQPIYQKFVWYPPWLVLVILLSPIIFIIVALIIQKKASLSITVCDAHRARKRNILLVTWLLLIPGTIALGVFGLMNEDFVLLFVVSLLLFFGVAIGAALAIRYLRPTKITDTHAWLKGADESFLRELPSV